MSMLHKEGTIDDSTLIQSPVIDAASTVDDADGMMITLRAAVGKAKVDKRNQFFRTLEARGLDPRSANERVTKNGPRSTCSAYKKAWEDVSIAHEMNRRISMLPDTWETHFVSMLLAETAPHLPSNKKRKWTIRENDTLVAWISKPTPLCTMTLDSDNYDIICSLWKLRPPTLVHDYERGNCGGVGNVDRHTRFEYRCRDVIPLIDYEDDVDLKQTLFYLDDEHLVKECTLGECASQVLVLITTSEDVYFYRTDLLLKQLESSHNIIDVHPEKGMDARWAEARLSVGSSAEYLTPLRVAAFLLVRIPSLREAVEFHVTALEVDESASSSNSQVGADATNATTQQCVAF